MAHPYDARDANNWLKNEKLVINARTEAGLVDPQTGEFMEIDVLIPSLRLAFEYQVCTSPIVCIRVETCSQGPAGEAPFYKCRCRSQTPGRAPRARCPKTSTSEGEGPYFDIHTLLVGWHSRKVKFSKHTLRLRNFLSSLAATIRQYRIDLDLPVPASASPVPQSPPLHFFDKDTVHIDDIGEPTNACFFTLSNVNPEKW